MAEDPNAELSRAEYWDKRYGSSEPTAATYDWLRNFNTIKPFLTKYLPHASTNPEIVHMGNGNSTLPADLLSLDYTKQTATDFSAVVIDNMRAKHPDVEWRVMDIRSLEFDDASFDIAIDKATLDAMLYGSLWDPEDEVKENVRRYVDEKEVLPEWVL
ncbi:hypothetical protein M8818_005246 [Zalaria obscura]|uniref:Uncharacterized protein n=1 Tax=Zalaria obscura TaxID=2024903 RepID=A0ACC3SBC0_9PEZI